MFWNLEKFSGNTAAILPGGQHYTYADLAVRADAFAAQLPAERSLVFLSVENQPASLAAYVGCLRHGHVPLLLAANIEPALLTLLKETYQPNAVWSAAGGLAILHKTEISMDSKLALLLSTSGSTGSPNLVRLSADNLNSNAEAIVQYLNLDSSERAITVLPMNYTYGLSVINSHLAVGATLLLTEESAIQREFWDFFKQQKGTSLVGVPYTYMLYRRAGVFAKQELPSLRYMTQAGGKLPAEDVKKVATWAQEHHVRFFVMYGQTEATARMSYLPPERTIEKCASVGIAIPGGRFAIEDESHREIAEDGKDGELIYYGPNVSLGYAEKQSDLALPDQNRGRLATGDMAYRDAEGYICITGRLKRFIKITGNRIGLDDVERRLKQRGFVCVCGGRDDLLCIAYTAEEYSPEELSAAVFDEFHIHASMFRLYHTAEIPRSNAGKILYAKLFEKFY